MGTDADLAGRLGLVLSGLDLAQLANLLHRLGVELATRQEWDARNYVVKAVACLDVDHVMAQLASATTEPPATS